MAPIHPFLLMGIGAVISFVAWINPDARDKLVLFFWVGMALIAWGVVKLLLRRKKAAAQQDTQASQQYAQQPNQHWQMSKKDPFPQQQVTQSPTYCPNCGKPKPPHHRFCQYCGYGV